MITRSHTFAGLLALSATLTQGHELVIRPDEVHNTERDKNAPFRFGERQSADRDLPTQMRFQAFAPVSSLQPPTALPNGLAAPVKLGTASSPIGPSNSGQPTGALSGLIVYFNAGHGWTADNDDSYPTDSDFTWFTQRAVTNGMVEDYGNLDQINFFANYLFNAGATVVPLRPLGYQPEERVLDNDDAGVTFTGSWSNGASAPWFGSTTDVPYRVANVNSTTESAVARYQPNLPTGGYWPVYTWALEGTNRTSQLYKITHSGGTSEVRVDHRRVGKGWIWLGTYYFEAGTAGYVDISNYSAAGGSVVIADAIRFGNGMGDVNPAGSSPISGYSREEELGRYWIERANGVNASGVFDSSVFNCCTADNDDGVGAPARHSAYMNNASVGTALERVYVGFHSNAGSGTTRGAMGLTTTCSGGETPNQTLLAQYLNDEVELDLEATDSGVLFGDDWVDNTIDVLAGCYGEFGTTALNGEMDGTIIEVAFHDNANDANLMKDPRVRNLMGRACYQALVKFFDDVPSGPLSAKNMLPGVPTHVRVRNSGLGQVTVEWTAPTVDAGGDGSATGYVVTRSTNGYGFGQPVVLSGVGSTSLVVSGLTPGETYYFSVAATNAGGQSMGSEPVAVRATATGLGAPVLIVNGFDRFQRSQAPTLTIASNLGSTGAGGGTLTLVRPRQINSFDYVVQHGTALADSNRYFESASNEAVASGQVVLANYSTVVWICGEESTADSTFSSAERLAVQTWLEGSSSRSLFSSGAEIGWDLDQSGNAPAFFNSVLKADYAGDDAGTYDVVGAGGSIFAGVSAINFSPGNGAPYDAEFPDQLSVSGGSVVGLTYSGGGGGNAAVYGQDGTFGYKVVTLGFPFEAITSSAVRADVMDRIMDYFAVPVPVSLQGWELE